jgi:oxidoreductase
VILGASGETGKSLLQFLPNHFDKIIVINRRQIGYPSDDKIEERIVNFNDLTEHTNQFKGAQVAFCCIGTTLSKCNKVESK